MNSPQRLRAAILQAGKTTMGFEIPSAVVDAPGSGRRPAPRDGKAR